MNIRNYTDKDYVQVKQILKESRLYDSTVDRPIILKRKIKESPGSILVAEKDHAVIGVVYYMYDAWYSTIYHLAIHPKFRKKGVGSLLLKEAEKHIKKHGGTYTTLNVLENEKHILPFYRKRKWGLFSKTYSLWKRL